MNHPDIFTEPVLPVEDSESNQKPVPKTTVVVRRTQFIYF